ncbi:MAG: IS110 family transposase [Gammaproteobacteria bacterium]|jgi:transposase|nr:IS110 family transposase [Gammaproteobacteria bacterium]
MFFAGIDVAKYRHELCLVDDNGSVVLQLHIDNSRTGLDKLIQNLERLNISANDVQFCLEATGHYWLSLYCHLTDLGYSVNVINPIQSDALRNLYIRKSKTDRKDALILADLIRFGHVSETKLASETVLKLQTLSRLRFEFVRQVGGLKNRVLGILDRIFPEYPQCFSNVFIITSRELLKTFTDPEELATADLSELSAFLREHSRGRLGMDRAEQIQALAKGTFGINLALDAFTLQLRLLVEQIEFIQEQINVIEAAIDQVMEEMRPDENTPYRHVLETIPGIGPVLAASIIGEVGDIHRFRNAKALVAFAGLDATVKASGQFEGTRNRLSKRGSPVLRHSIWMAAISARRFNPELKEFFENKRSQGKHTQVATGAVARRLVHLIYSLWKENRPFDPNYQWSPNAN